MFSKNTNKISKLAGNQKLGKSFVAGIRLGVVGSSNNKLLSEIKLI